MLPARRVSAICHDLRFIVRKEFPGKETTRGERGARPRPAKGARRRKHRGASVAKIPAFRAHIANRNNNDAGFRPRNVYVFMTFISTFPSALFYTLYINEIPRRITFQ